jgi:hypothetical protein
MFASFPFGNLPRALLGFASLLVRQFLLGCLRAGFGVGRGFFLLPFLGNCARCPVQCGSSAFIRRLMILPVWPTPVSGSADCLRILRR